MTSAITNGKYKQRKDWATNSFLNSEENISPVIDNKESLSKPPRRNSLALGLLLGRTNEKIYKRKSSLSMSILGKKGNRKIIKNIPKTNEYEIRNDNNDVIVSSPNNELLDNQSLKKECNLTENEIEISCSNETDTFLIKNEIEDKRRSSLKQAKLARYRRKNFENHSRIEDKFTQQNNKTGFKGFSKTDFNLNKQKRHSWWNIFIPEPLKQRSRRASQDVYVMSRSADSIVPPSRRSKSRSVDHGLGRPFDLDSLRSTIDSHFESLDKLSKDGDKKKSLTTIPTKPYTVRDRDTLTSVAARFDTTPSELSKLNRLVSSFIYPGQTLLVPYKEDTTICNEESTVDSEKLSPLQKEQTQIETSPIETELLSDLRPGSPKLANLNIIDVNKEIDVDQTDDPVITQRFLKINVRHITDGQGVVGGVLLVTPNAIMFDPNVSDLLVIEHGPESYGVIAPMEFVVNAAIFYDIAHMRVSGAESCNEKVEIYYPKVSSRCNSSQSPGKDSLIKDETFAELGLGSVDTCDDQQSVCSSNEREGDAFPKAFDRDRITPTSPQEIDASKQSIDEGNIYETENKTKEDNSNENQDEKQRDIDGNLLIKKDLRTLEERRKSLLDHHWAVPSKDKCSDEDEDEEQESQTNLSSYKACDILKYPLGSTIINKLKSNSLHDSGIDMKYSAAQKKNFTDADIVLGSEWIPPKALPTLPNQNTLKTSSTDIEETDHISESNIRKKTSSVSFNVEENVTNILKDVQTDKIEKPSDQSKKNKMLKRLSYPLTWVEGLAGDVSKSNDTDSAPNTGDSNQSVFSKVFSSSPITLVSEFGGNLFLSKTPSEDSGGSSLPPFSLHSEGSGTPGRSSIGTFMRPHSTEGTNTTTKSNKIIQPKLDYRSMVSIDDKPELFVSFDKLIPRPARACPDPPLYLRLRMGKPIGKEISFPPSVMSYGKNKLRPEYWFSVPKNRVDELYRFIQTWVKHLYGELDEEQIQSRGYELIQNDTEWQKELSNKDAQQDGGNGDDINELTKESWELLKAPYVKIYNIIKTAGSYDMDLLGGEVRVYIPYKIF